MNTTVINLWGGPGVGKDSCMAGLFNLLKRQGITCEQIPEAAKRRAWKGEKISSYDQLVILGEQIALESALYGKVEYAIACSPVALSPYYQSRYSPWRYTRDAVRGYLHEISALGVQHLNFMLERCKPYDPAGRYETEPQAQEIDRELVDYCERVMGLRLVNVPGPEHEDWIFEQLCGPFVNEVSDENR